AVCGSTVQASADGGRYQIIGSVTGTRRRLRAVLAPGHAYDIRVRARDCRGAHGPWQTSHVLVRAASGASAVIYSRAWYTAQDGTRATPAAGARVSFTFSADAVGILAMRGWAFGTAAVYLDGERVPTLDLHAAHRARLALAYRVAVPSGRHTLTLRILRDGGHTGAAIRAFAVLG
ncbi:MAG TPA: hypothetical protein VHL51_02600, partial [Gaiellales bacterium]|nr:hypothetical protein [Gaiellales bacterium]